MPDFVMVMLFLCTVRLLLNSHEFMFSKWGGCLQAVLSSRLLICLLSASQLSYRWYSLHTGQLPQGSYHNFAID
jgi:uncharacterized protein (DUF486 family)